MAVDSAQDLLPDLMPQGVGFAELQSILTNQLGGALYDPNQSAFFYPNVPPFALRLELNQKLEPRAAFAEEALTNDKLETVKQSVRENFVDSSGAGVAQSVLFAAAPVLGYWRYRDHFHLLPIALEAPRPKQLIAAHPFLLETSYKRAPDFMIDGGRRGREVQRVGLILGALLRGPVTWISNKHIGARGQEWVLLPQGGDATRWECAYCQLMYSHSSIKGNCDDFTSLDPYQPMPLIPAAEYYSSKVDELRHQLHLPDDLVDSFDRFFNLPHAEQDRFLRACYWLNQVYRVDSFSLIFLSAVQAIEALAWAPRREASCPTCGKPQGPGPTRLFNEFLDKYAPAAEVGRRELYKVRSGLTHGSRPPFLLDVEVILSFTPKTFEQREHVTDAIAAAKSAVHNWLRDPVPVPNAAAAP